MLIISMQVQRQKQTFRGKEAFKEEYKPNKSIYEIKNLVENRKPVTDIFEFPRNIVGYVKTNFYRKNDKNKQKISSLHGSGVLIAQNLVLTCVHTIISPGPEYQVTQECISFFLAFNEHLGQEYTVKKCYKPSKLQEEQKIFVTVKSYDFALLVLNQAYQHMSQYRLNFIWEEARLDSIMQQKPKVSTYGYPRDLNQLKLKSLKKKITNENFIGYQFESQGYLFKSNQPGLIQHNMTADVGQSGSPIFLHDGDNPQNIYLIGIHKGYYTVNQISYGIALWRMKKYIKQWLKEQDMVFKMVQIMGQDDDR